jgi:hypothetical protein
MDMFTTYHISANRTPPSGPLRCAMRPVRLADGPDWPRPVRQWVTGRKGIADLCVEPPAFGGLTALGGIPLHHPLVVRKDSSMLHTLPALSDVSA